MRSRRSRAIGSKAGTRSGLATTAMSPDELNARSTRAEAMAALRVAFREAGLDSPVLAARALVAGLLGLDATELAIRPETPIGPDGAERLREAVRRRITREPVARILGQREFWGLAFALSPATLEPRPDTETLVSAVLDRLDRDGRIKDPLRLVDLGTGTGCILVALLSELPDATGLGLDRSAMATAAALANAIANGVGDRAWFAVSDWAAATAGPFDVVVSNPPYIASPAIARLMPEVAGFDPVLALDGGNDGLDAYRVIAADAPRILAPDGLVAFEVGAGQAFAVGEYLRAAGLASLATAADLNGIGRVVLATRR